MRTFHKQVITAVWELKKHRLPVFSPWGFGFGFGSMKLSLSRYTRVSEEQKGNEKFVIKAGSQECSCWVCSSLGASVHSSEASRAWLMCSDRPAHLAKGCAWSQFSLPYHPLIYLLSLFYFLLPVC